MALDIPGGLFEQGDVRETPAATATATATVTGLDDPEYVVLTADATLNNERVLTAGEGIDLDDAGAGSTITVKGEDASTTNKGIAKFAAGEGLDVGASSGTITYSGENASTTNKGVASFNTNDFTVSSGAVSLKNKTSYLAISGMQFHGINPDTDPLQYDKFVGALNIDAGTSVMAQVNLPHGAVVTGCVVYADYTTDTWELIRHDIADGANEVQMATAALNTEDTSISSGTIDNQNYTYMIVALNMDSSQILYSARITYTTDYD